jgi:HEAT repeat protein
MRNGFGKCWRPTGTGFVPAPSKLCAAPNGIPGRASRVGLLLANHMLEDVLCASVITFEKALMAARLAVEIDPKMELRLARRLAEGFSDGEDALTANAQRLLAVLEEISDGSRILPSLVRLFHSPHPYVRSKAVLLLARGNRSANWVQSRMVELDPRVRANAVEALWGIEGSQVRMLLGAAVRDSNNRVAGNALVGLYRVGECEALEETVRMANHPSPQFRATAAWVMGRCADPRFREPLAHLLRDASATVRARALKSLSSIKAAPARVSGGRLRLSSMLLDASAGPQPVRRRLQVAVMSEDGRIHRKVLPIQFAITEGTCPILQYRVTLRPVPEAMSVIIVLPRSEEAAVWSKAVRRCLKWKRTLDLWTFVPWALGEGDESAPIDEAPLTFTARPDLLWAQLNGFLPRRQRLDFWHAWWRALRAKAAVTRGKRHILVLAGEPVSGAAGLGLAEALEAARGQVQVIATSPNPAIEDVCLRTRTSLVKPVGNDTVATAIEQAYLNLLGRYEIEYQPQAAEAVQVEISVQTEEGSGSAVVAVPASPAL